MHPYTVVVADKKKQRLSIPCAELETAQLVQKNLESLFPGSKITIKNQEVIAPLEVPKNLGNLSLVKPSRHNDYSELEEELFNDVA